MTDDPQAPWGGFKYSGVGREYGRYGIEAFLETRDDHGSFNGLVENSPSGWLLSLCFNLWVSSCGSLEAYAKCLCHEHLTCGDGRPSPGSRDPSYSLSLFCCNRGQAARHGLRHFRNGNVYAQFIHNCELPGITGQGTAPALIPGFCQDTGLREGPLDHHVLTGLYGGQQLPLMRAPGRVPAAPDPAQVAGAVDRYMALREFRARLYRCLTARADALFELCDGAPRGAVVPDGGERPSIALPS